MTAARTVRTFTDHRAWLAKRGVVNGFVFDLDDVVFETYVDWFGRAEKIFGNPRGLTAHEALAEGIFLQDYWNFPEAHAFFQALSENDDIYDEVELVEGILDVVKHVAVRMQMVGYYTARPASSYDRTWSRLAREGFPEAPLIMRPGDVSLLHGSKWKAAGLHEVFPHVGHIADDSRSLPRHLGPSYRGTIYMIRAHQADHPGVDVRPCPTVRHVRDHV